MKSLAALKTVIFSAEPSARWLSAVVLCSLLTVLLFWALIPASAQANESVDYLYYYKPVAQNLVAGNGLVTDSGGLATRYPPGYPILVAATLKLALLLSISPVATNLALTLICHALAAIFIFLLTYELWGSRGALLATLVWISYPPILWLTKQPSSELPFMAIFYSSIYLLWSAFWRKWQWGAYFLAGLLSGVAALIRPIGLGAGLMMGLALLLVARGQSLRLRLVVLALLVAGNVTAILPWQVWVYARTGRVVVLSDNLVPAMRDGLRFAVNLKSYRQAVPVPADVRALMTQIDRRYSEMTSITTVARVVADEARPHPLALVKLLAIKTARSWYATDSGRHEGLILVFQIVYLVLISWSSYRAWRAGGSAGELTAGCGLTTLYFWSMTVLSLSILRYLTPVIGLLFVLLPALWTRPVKEVSDGSESR